MLVLESGRPDFDGALMQFLIGLLQTAAPPPNHDQWIDWLEEPPTPEILKKKFLKFEEVFDLDGDGPRFMREYPEFV
ncbi:MAG: type I-E CRISPR-associated protein Cse1/CasA [Gammaproteobacteria bacterium]|nr:type I-E CRISPR-associated protein Cse1/CasA [Gammaproteobacteria bacterium]